MAQIGQNWPKMALGVTDLAPIGQNWQGSVLDVRVGSDCPELAWIVSTDLTQIGQNLKGVDQKWVRLVRIGLEWLRLARIDKELALKQACSFIHFAISLAPSIMDLYDGIPVWQWKEKLARVAPREGLPDTKNGPRKTTHFFQPLVKNL